MKLLHGYVLPSYPVVFGMYAELVVVVAGVVPKLNPVPTLLLVIIGLGKRLPCVDIPKLVIGTILLLPMLY